MPKFRCCAISDTHEAAFHESLKLKGGDFLFHAGDISYFGQPSEVYPFLEWFAKQPYTHKVFIAGNHDFGFEPISEGKICETDGSFYFRGREFMKGLQNQYKKAAEDLGITYLNKQGVVLDGVSIYGIPDQPAFCGWAFNYGRGGEYVKQIMAAIPDNLDILITHGPPAGILDKVEQHGDYRAGCPVLLQEVLRAKPKFHIFGHLHSGHGKTKQNGTTFINAAICGIPYSELQKPFDFVLRKRK